LQYRETAQIDYSRKWYVMAAVAMGTFLATIDGSIVNVALPTLTRAFDTQFSTVQWVVLAYLLTVTTLMLSVGRLADMRGKKPIYTAGFAIFTIGSVLCGLSPSIYALIAFRVFQGVGAAMTMALGMAIVTESFPAAARGRALGIMGAVVSVGIVLGPTLGGFIIDALSWRWVFFVNLPIGILGIFMVLRFVPAIRPPGGQRFDFLGAATLFVALLALLLALTLGQDAGFAELQVLALFVVAAVFLVLFILIELGTEQPMIDLRLFKNRLFSISLTTGYIIFVCIAGTIILMPFYLENVLGYDIRQVGLLLAVVPIGLGVTAPISGSLSDRFGTRPITVIGLAVMLVGFYAVSTLGEETTALGYVLRFLPIGIGVGMFQSPNNSAIMGSAPRERLGIASGMLAVTRTLGQTTGIAILGALWASRVFAYTGEILEGGATEAPAAAQVAGIHDTFRVTALLIAVALALASWSLVRERRERSLAPAVTQPTPVEETPAP
jgi:EmrB/QacA subfamily drug resistance transporter